MISVIIVTNAQRCGEKSGPSNQIERRRAPSTTRNGRLRISGIIQIVHMIDTSEQRAANRAIGRTQFPFANVPAIATKGAPPNALNRKATMAAV